jgi:hypothetical protein
MSVLGSDSLLCTTAVQCEVWYLTRWLQAARVFAQIHLCPGAGCRSAESLKDIKPLTDKTFFVTTSARL